jgi:4-hydroxybenzoyl-CoA thioesterase
MLPATEIDRPKKLDRAKEFVAKRLVRFSHCDPAGIVFFPRYLELLNGVVEDWWAHISKPWAEIIYERRLGTPTVQLNSTFLAPSKLGETIYFHLAVGNVGRSSLELRHRIIGADGRERARFEQFLVLASLENLRSMPWPEDFRQAITRYTEGS